MKQINRILMILLLATFVSSTIASNAFAKCDCPYMQVQGDDAASMDGMPCHGMNKSEETSNTDSDTQKADCTGCGCGNCNITAPAALPNQVSHTQFINSDAAATPENDFIKSLFPHGIDYPPKRLS